MGSMRNVNERNPKNHRLSTHTPRPHGLPVVLTLESPGQRSSRRFQHGSAATVPVQRQISIALVDMTHIACAGTWAKPTSTGSPIQKPNEPKDAQWRTKHITHRGHVAGVYRIHASRAASVLF
jgi:hypothetical protein